MKAKIVNKAAIDAATKAIANHGERQVQVYFAKEQILIQAISWLSFLPIWRLLTLATVYGSLSAAVASPHTSASSSATAFRVVARYQSVGDSLTIEDHGTAILNQTLFAAAPDGTALPRRERPRVTQNQGKTVVTESFGVSPEESVTLTVTYRTQPSGELMVTTRAESTAVAQILLKNMFAASGSVHPYWIPHQNVGREGSTYLSPGPQATHAPLPVIGLREQDRRYAVLSGSTWEYPLPDGAEPRLHVDGMVLSVPEIGTAEHPLQLNPNEPREWLTVIAGAPTPRPADGPYGEEYALELGAQIAIYNIFSGASPILLQRDEAATLRQQAASDFRAICFSSAYWLRVTTPSGKRSLTPAAHYSPGSWSRDSFWTALGLRGSPLEAQTEAEMLSAYASAVPRTGDHAGRVPLLIRSQNGEGGEGAPVAFDDESGLYFLIRMQRDADVLDIPGTADLPIARLVLQYILENQVREGRFVTAGPAPFLGNPFSPNGWLDGYRYEPGDVITSNQGIFVVALESARRLGVTLPAGLQQRALTAYRDSYDPALGWMRWLSSRTYRSPDVLIGEALSLYLFNQPLLSDETVQKTLGAQVWTPYGMQVLATREGGYVSETEFLNTTNNGHSEEPAGWYQNGGSWLLWEYLAGYAARRHGDRNACTAMRRSIDAEVAITPTSKEFKLTTISPGLTHELDPDGNRILGSTDDNRQGYGWNAAIFAFDKDLRAHRLGCLP